MFKRLVITSGLCSLFALSAVASAATQDFNRWTFDQGRTSKNTPYCGLFTSSNTGPTIKNLMIKDIAGHGVLNITIYKDSWNIPEGKSVPISIELSGEDPVVLTAYGDGKILDMEVPKEGTAAFLIQLAYSDNLKLVFKAGNERPWSAALSKIKPALQQFLECSTKQENTQPF